MSANKVKDYIIYAGIAAIIFLVGIAAYQRDNIETLSDKNYELTCQLHGGHRYDHMDICVDGDNRIIKLG